MFYAKFIQDKYETPTVADTTNQPLNFIIAGFETQAERERAIDAAWQAGGNGFKISRPGVASYYGRRFSVYGEANIADRGDEWTQDQRFQDAQNFDADLTGCGGIHGWFMREVCAKVREAVAA